MEEQFDDDDLEPLIDSLIEQWSHPSAYCEVEEQDVTNIVSSLLERAGENGISPQRVLAQFPDLAGKVAAKLRSLNYALIRDLQSD